VKIRCHEHCQQHCDSTEETVSHRYLLADATQNKFQTLFSKTLSPKSCLGLPLRTCWRRTVTRFILPTLSAFILKNGQMPLLKRINTASGISICQEKMRGRKK
jgi:hypothetical protein